MALICDTGGVYALYDADDAYHVAVRAVVEAESGPLFLLTILLAELDISADDTLGNGCGVGLPGGADRWSLCADPSHC